ncbi:MAG: hypothetical protein KDA92_11480 [Planctomycetales bacterium]|nr:hypothetical protein [Planctomycetales bacterium]MCA9169597.1 hypothetical protein [Planctomycetales bacterium]
MPLTTVVAARAPTQQAPLAAKDESTGRSWWFLPYNEDPKLSRRGRAKILLAGGGTFSALLLVAVVGGPFIPELAGSIAILIQAIPLLGLAVGTVVDGYAMTKHRRISWAGRFSVFAVVVALSIVWCVVVVTVRMMMKE